MASKYVQSYDGKPGAAPKDTTAMHAYGPDSQTVYFGGKAVKPPAAQADPNQQGVLGNAFGGGYGAGNGSLPTSGSPGEKASDFLTNPKFGGKATAPGPVGGRDASGNPNAPGGSESGPGILEQWFNQRANGIDQGYQYAMDRGTRNLNNEAAARGGYNSGATLQSIGDFSANMGAQREAQLDALAGGASGEHSKRLEDMFGIGTTLAKDQAGTAGGYDSAAGAGLSESQKAQLQLLLNKMGVDPAQAKALFNSGMSMLSLFGGGGKGIGGGGGDSMMPPSGG